MPSDVILMACYSQLKVLDRFGVQLLTDDYSLCSDAPSDYFLKVQKLASGKRARASSARPRHLWRGVRLDTLHALPEQHQRRWDKVAQEQVRRCIHPLPAHRLSTHSCQDLARQNMFLTERTARRSGSVRRRIGPNGNLRLWQRSRPTRAGEPGRLLHRHPRLLPLHMGGVRYPGRCQSAPGQPFYPGPTGKSCRARGRAGASTTWTATGIRARSWSKAPRMSG